MINSKNKIHKGGGGRKEYIDLGKGFCFKVCVLLQGAIFWYHIG